MVIGTLCDQITYPHRLEPQERTFEVEEKLRTLLQKVGVRYFVLGLTDLPAAYAYDNIFSKSCCRRRRRRRPRPRHRCCCCCCCELAANWLRLVVLQIEYLLARWVRCFAIMIPHPLVASAFVTSLIAGAVQGDDDDLADLRDADASAGQY